MSIKTLPLVLCGLLFSCGRGSSSKSEHAITYYEDGKVKEIAQLENGMTNGKAFLFNEDGSKTWEFNYLQDKREGLQLRYYYGKLYAIEPYLDGKQAGWSRYYSVKTGCLHMEGNVVNDKRTGLWYEYSGKILIEIDIYVNDTVSQVIYRHPDFPQGTERKADSVECDCPIVILEK